MPNPLIFDKPFHQKLSSFITSFGYLSASLTDIGVCNGVSWMGIKAARSGNLDQFLKRLAYLNKITLVQLNADIEKSRRKVKNKEELLPEDLIALDIPAFFDGVAAFQHPKKLLDGIGKAHNDYVMEVGLTTQLAFPTSETGLALMFLPHQESKGLFQMPLPLNCFTKEEFIDFFLQLNILLEERNVDLVFPCNALNKDGGHTTFFSYHAEKKAWQFFDINNHDYLEGSLPFMQDPTHLAECLFGASEKYRLIYFNVISNTDDKSQVVEMLEKFKCLPAFKSAVLFSEDKVKFIKELNSAFLAGYIAKTDDVTSLEEMIKHGLLETLIDKELLSMTIELGSMKLINKLLDLKIAISPLALTCAAARGDLVLMKRLLEAGRKLEIDSEGNHPLICAAINGKIEMVHFLIEECHLSETSHDAAEINLLHAAVISGDATFVKAIINLKKFSLDQKKTNDDTALNFAITLGYYNIVELLLKEGAAVDINALMLAVQNGKLEMLKLCFTANQEFFFLHIAVLLFCASIHNQKAIIAWLLEQGATINITDDKAYTPLHMSMGTEGNRDTIELLLQHNATLSPLHLSNQITLLHVAVANNRCDLVPWLLEQYPDDLNKKTLEGETLLGVAVKGMHLEMSRLLISAGLNVEKKYIDTAIHQGNFELAFLLAEKFNKKNHDKSLFLNVFKRTLPHMNNSQIINLFDRLIVLSDPTFGFIHQKRHDFFDRLRLGAVRLKLRFQAPRWQTATFCEVSFKLGEQFIANLERGEKISPAWEKDRKLQIFIHASLGNFFDSKSKEREKKILVAIQNALSIAQNIPREGVNP